MTAQEREPQGIDQETRTSAHEANVRLYGRALQVLEPHPYIPLSAGGLNTRAQLQLKFGDFPSVLQTLTDIKRPTETVIKTYIELSDAKSANGDLAGAVSVLDAATNVAGNVELDRDGYNRWNSLIDLSTSFAKLGQADKAISALDLLKKEGGNTGRDNTLYGLAGDLAASGNEEGAMKVVAEIDEDEGKAFALGLMEEAYAKKGDFDSCERIRSVNQIPNLGTTRAFIAGAEFHLGKGNVVGARDMMLQAAQSLSGMEHEWQKTMWQMQIVDFALEKANDIATAREVADQMAPDIETVYSYNSIAKAQHASGDSEGALSTLQLSEQKADEVPEETNKNIRNRKLESMIDVIGTHMAINNILYGVEKLETFRQAILTDQSHFYDYVRDQSSRGNFEVAIHLIEMSPDSRARGMLAQIAEDRIKLGQKQEAEHYIDGAFESIRVPFNQEPRTDTEYVKQARESHYSFGRIARLYSEAGNSQKARESLNKLYDILYATREADNRAWYDNTMRLLVFDAVAIGAFDIAERAAAEIEWPVNCGSALVEIATALIDRGRIDTAITLLKEAEDEADEVKDTDPTYKSEGYLAISNAYYQIEKSASTA